MSLWGKSLSAESRPKGFPDDSNSKYARENIFATNKGWVVRGVATGNDNANADPEILVWIKDLATEGVLGSANVIGVDFTAAAYADGATFQMTLTFDEAVYVNSEAYAAATDSKTDRVYITMDCLGATDMVADDTVDLQYFSGTGTNAIVFQGLLPTTPNGYLAFTTGHLEINGSASIIDKSSIGSLVMEDSTPGERVPVALDNDGEELLLNNNGDRINTIATESGTDQTGGASGNQSVIGRIVLDGTDGTIVKTNGAVAGSTSFTVDNVTGTIAVGQKITVKPGASASISDAFSDTGISTDGTLTVVAVASQTSFTVSEAVTVANNIDLLLDEHSGDNLLLEAIDLDLEGFDGATSVIGTSATKTGDTVAVTTTTSGSGSGSAAILTGVTTT
tara:strand:+ start:318 stop:1496 length:1179 start_codon:yes stop_codon:yes gene_type:complete